MLISTNLVLVLSLAAQTGQQTSSAPQMDRSGTPMATDAFSSGDILRTLDTGFEVGNAAVANNHGTLAFLSSLDENIWWLFLAEQNNGSHVGDFGLPGGIFTGLGFDTSRNLYLATKLSGSFDSTITAIQQNGLVKRTLFFPVPWATGVAWDNQRDIYWVSNASSISPVHPISGNIVGPAIDTFSLGASYLNAITYNSANDTLIVAAGGEGEFFVIDATSGDLIDRFPGVGEGGPFSSDMAGVCMSDTGNIWQTNRDDSKVYELKIHQVVLQVDGTAPGLVNLDVSSATPFGTLGFAYGAAGFSMVPSALCARVGIDIANPMVAAQLTADGNGELNITLNLPAGLAGATLQVLDLGSCSTSNPTTL